MRDSTPHPEKVLLPEKYARALTELKASHRNMCFVSVLWSE